MCYLYYRRKMEFNTAFFPIFVLKFASSKNMLFSHPNKLRSTFFLQRASLLGWHDNLKVFVLKQRN